MLYKEAKELANKLDKNLRSDDPRLRRLVLVIHEEGTILTYRYAFVEIISDYYFICTEHHGILIYHIDDIYHISQWENISIFKDESEEI